MISLEEFHQDFLQSVLSDSQSRGLLKPQAFLENVCEELISTGDLSNNYVAAEFIKTGMEVYGYDYDDERQILSLIVHQFFQEEEIQTLLRDVIDTKFKRLRTFYEKSAKGLYSQLEEAFEAYSMAFEIYNLSQKNKIRKIKLIVITDGKSTRTLGELPNSSIGDIIAEHRVIDIQYLHKIYLSENSGGDFSVDLNIPYLLIDTATDEYTSYLTRLSGETLVNIYEDFGQRLFEQNVRTFLQFRGKVNKGLRNTIETRPEMFFAYNNGITATATNVEVANDRITKIENFQIVNGGQTTSSIYAASKNSKLDVSKIFVQMKLSIVKNPEKQNDFVSDVSEYANTQNKVNKSDFFSNSPFHKEFKAYSERIWVAAQGGSQYRTHWFYERVRGEYLNKQAYLTSSQKKQFQLENPKAHLIDKTFLSKSENAWLQRPDIVSKGAQYSFSHFAEVITKELEKNDLLITEDYFKEAIARVILFKHVEKLVSSAEWYGGGYRAPAVAYTIAYLSYAVEKMGKYLNFNLIWEKQKIPYDLNMQLEIIAEKVYASITNPPAGNANIGQWCKKEQCWKAIKALDVPVKLDEIYFNDKEERKYIKKEAKKVKELDSGIEIQSFVLSYDRAKWKTIYEYYSRPQMKQSVSLMQYDILGKFVSGRLALPSPKQSKILYDLYKGCVEDGFII